MLCQNCKINESTIHLYTNVNGHRTAGRFVSKLLPNHENRPRTFLVRRNSNANNHGTDPIDDFSTASAIFNKPQEPTTPPYPIWWSLWGSGGYGSNPSKGGQPQPSPQKPKGLLEEFGINVTELARRGEIDPVIGRDEEIVRVIEILNRRTKNNPVLYRRARSRKNSRGGRPSPENCRWWCSP